MRGPLVRFWERRGGAILPAYSTLALFLRGTVEKRPESGIANSFSGLWVGEYAYKKPEKLFGVRRLDAAFIRQSLWRQRRKIVVNLNLIDHEAREHSAKGRARRSFQPAGRTPQIILGQSGHTMMNRIRMNVL